jgi:uncharacterized membrane protein
VPDARTLCHPSTKIAGVRKWLIPILLVLFGLALLGAVIAGASAVASHSENWSVEITRQAGFDLWTYVCIGASLVLLSYGVLGHVRSSPHGMVILCLIVAGVGGTIVVIAAPPLHSPFVGIGWTFALLCILSAAFYLNLSEQLGLRRVAFLLSLRIVALAMLMLMLFEPVLRYISTPKPERPLIFLIDTSGSMSFPDVQNGPTRIQSVWQTLRPQLPLIQQNFVPQYFTFATGTDPLAKPEYLAKTVADGKATDLVQAISKGLATSSRDDAVVMLISDGGDNVNPNVVDAIRDSQRKICTLTVGSEQAEPAAVANVAVDNVACDEDFAVGHESKIVATIKSTALPNRLVEVKMAEVDDAGKPIGEIQVQKLVLQPIVKGQEVDLTYKPEKVGVHKLAVWIDPIPGERNILDNRQEFQGLALDPRIKVLYVEGRLRPEYKYLNRALGHDPNIEESTLVRLQQDKFAASSEGEGQQLQALPTTLEDWKKFDVIILGDLDSTFLTKIQQAQIEQAVSDGAGLIMIGGQNNFGPGGYKDTPIEKLLPVLVGDVTATQDKNEFLPQLTVAGLGHPSMEGLDQWFPGPSANKPAKELPALRGNIVVGSIKTGAEVLLTHPGVNGPNGSPEIVLAAERYGKGRSAAFTADTTYLWYLSLRDEGQDSPYNRLWGQMIRWLAGADVRNRQNGAGVTGLLNKSVYQFGEIASVRALVRDEKGDATKFAQVNITVSSNAWPQPKALTLSPVDSHIGMYEAKLPDPEHGIAGLAAGDYTINMTATKDGKEIGKQQLKFSVIPPADEMLKIAANPALMREIADTTGGYSRELEGLPEMLNQLIRSDPHAVKSQQRAIPLANTFRTVLDAANIDVQWPNKYDLPMQGFWVVCLLAGEWVLRRKWQLP